MAERSRVPGRTTLGLIGLACLGAAALLIGQMDSPQAQAKSPATREAILTFGVGGVLASDGTLWQYRPDTGEWLSIDEAMRKEGYEDSHILPLPVPVEDVAEMESFGFLRTRQGDLWLYEMAANSWVRLPELPAADEQK